LAWVSARRLRFIWAFFLDEFWPMLRAPWLTCST